MTHTAGFEDDLRGLWASDVAELMPLRDWLVTYMPARVHGLFRRHG